MKKIHYGLAPVMQRGGDKGPGSVVSYYLLVGLKLRLLVGLGFVLSYCSSISFQFFFPPLSSFASFQQIGLSWIIEEEKTC
jgi:hypothetical protein